MNLKWLSLLNITNPDKRRQEQIIISKICNSSIFPVAIKSWYKYYPGFIKDSI